MEDPQLAILFPNVSRRVLAPTEFFTRIMECFNVDMPWIPDTFEPKPAAQFVSECIGMNPAILTGEMLIDIGCYACLHLSETDADTAYAIIRHCVNHNLHRFFEFTTVPFEKMAASASGDLWMALLVCSEFDSAYNECDAPEYQAAYARLEDAYETIVW
jgi:hypothetical protein